MGKCYKTVLFAALYGAGRKKLKRIFITKRVKARKAAKMAKALYSYAHEVNHV